MASLVVTATDDVGVTRVSFDRWDAVNLVWVHVGDISSAPYSLSLDTAVLNPGWNQIDASAIDAAGNSTTDYIWIVRP